MLLLVTAHMSLANENHIDGVITSWNSIISNPDITFETIAKNELEKHENLQFAINGISIQIKTNQNKFITFFGKPNLSIFKMIPDCYSAGPLFTTEKSPNPSVLPPSKVCKKWPNSVVLGETRVRINFAKLSDKQNKNFYGVISSIDNLNKKEHPYWGDKKISFINTIEKQLPLCKSHILDFYNLVEKYSLLDVSTNEIDYKNIKNIIYSIEAPNDKIEKLSKVFLNYDCDKNNLVLKHEFFGIVLMYDSAILQYKANHQINTEPNSSGSEYNAENVLLNEDARYLYLRRNYDISLASLYFEEYEKYHKLPDQTVIYNANLLKQSEIFYGRGFTPQSFPANARTRKTIPNNY